MKHNFKNAFLISVCFFITYYSQAQYSVWINEFSYDDNVADDLEFIEIAGLANANLKDYKIYFMNGGSDPKNAVKYQTSNLSSLTIPNEKNGYGAALVSFSQGTFQNGANDGLALVYKDSLVIQFISYEGGMSSTIFTNGTKSYISDSISVSQSGKAEDDTMSIQLTGAEYYGSNANWIKVKKTPGFLNENQNPKNITLGLENTFTNNSTLLYPNPISDISNLVFSNPQSEKAILSIYNLENKCILTKETYENKFILENNEFENSGFYMFQIRIGNNLISNKLMVE